LKKYLFLSLGFEKPTPEIMSAWNEWMESISDRILDNGGLWGGGREMTKNGTNDLPLDMESITGFIILNAEDLDEAEKMAQGCPIIVSNRVYEIMTK
jgi:hypothetical protein